MGRVEVDCGERWPSRPNRSRDRPALISPQGHPSVVEEYVTAAVDAGFREVRLVHGRGRGVQRGIVQAALEKHPRVISFADDTPHTSERRSPGFNSEIGN